MPTVHCAHILVYYRYGGMTSKYVCRNCNAESIFVSSPFTWCEKRSCPTPDCQQPDWYICLECTRNHRYAVGTSFAKHKMLHETKRINPFPQNEATPSMKRANVRGHQRAHDHDDDEDNVLLHSNLDDELDDHSTSTNIRPFDSTIFLRKESQEFFQEEIEKGRGTAMLVSQACLDFGGGQVDPSEERYHMRNAQLCYMLSSGQRTLLAEVIKLAVACAEKQRLRHSSSPNGHTETDEIEDDVVETPIVTDQFPQFMRSTYLNKSKSIIRSLPHPLIARVDNDHAYVSLREIISDILAKGLPRGKPLCTTYGEEKQPAAVITEIVDSERFRLIRDCCARLYQDEEVRIFAIIEWSDDFQQNNTKDNRGGVWIKSVTLYTVDPATNELVEVTYPMSLAPKGSDHELLQRYFANDLKSLREGSEDSPNYFYDKNARKMVRVYADLFASLNDQPEKRGNNYVLAGNSTLHARFGYAADLSLLAGILPACDTCLDHLRRHVNEAVIWPSDYVCDNCVNWDMDLPNELLSVKPPQGYPSEYLDSNGMILPRKLTYEHIVEAVADAREKVEAGAWCLSTAQIYLKYHCLTETIIDRLLSPCLNRQVLRQSLKKPRNTRDEQDTFILNHSKEKEEMYKDVELPAIWTRNCDLRQQVDVLMHLLFLGVQKTVVHVIGDWIKLMGKTSQFVAYMSTALKDIPYVSWCPVATYTGDKLGGWVSENYLALARISKWMYAPLEQIVPDTPEYEGPDPDIPVQRWSKTVCISWFAARRITLDHLVNESAYEFDDETRCILSVYNKTNKKGLKDIPVAKMRTVIAVIQNSSAVPPLATQRACRASDILELVRCLHSMIAHIMSASATDDSILAMNIRIKLFLSIFDRVTCSMVPTKNETTRKKPKWLTSYNFVCLLNIPEATRHLGPLRNLWEGGTKGEGFIRFAKSELNQGLRKNWQENTLSKMLKNETLHTLLGNKEESDDDPVRRIGYIHRYPNLVEVSLGFEAAQVFVAILLENNLYAIRIKDYKGPRCIHTSVQLEVAGEDFNGHHYLWFQLHSDDVVHLDTGQEHEVVLLLPFPKKVPRENKDNVDGLQLYTVINSEWWENDEDGNIGLR